MYFASFIIKWIIIKYKQIEYIYIYILYIYIYIYSMGLLFIKNKDQNKTNSQGSVQKSSIWSTYHSYIGIMNQTFEILAV